MRTQLEPLVGIKASCRLSGINRSTYYRHRDPSPTAPRKASRVSPPNRLSPAERHHITTVLNSERFRDKAPRQVWAALLDEGVYLCSVSTMYRLLRAQGQSRERRAQARHPAKAKPQLMARAPNQVWSWDITKLRGPGPGRFFDLYVMIDIYSRYVVHWEVHSSESGHIASHFIQNCIRANEVISASLFLDIGQRQRGLHDPPDLGRAHRGVAQHSPPAGEYRHRALADAP